MPSSSTTTSWPSSTRRLARSMASSATIVWSAAGRSKVEEMTSPLVDRSKSVTSSGRSSTSTTIRWHSGLLVVIDFAIDCMIIVLPALAGEPIRPRWPLPIGAAMSMTQPLGRVERGELAELDAVLGRLGVGAVHLVDADHRVELLATLALTGLAHLADDRVA